VTAPVAVEAPAAPSRVPSKADITCFRCHHKGHKSPNCPSRPKGNRRVKLLSEKLLYLQSNELFGQVGRHSMPITCDSCAEVSVVPEESVEEEELTGETQILEDFHTGRVEGNVCNVGLTIAGRSFRKRAVTLPGEMVTLPGEMVRWTPFMAIPLAPRDEMEFILTQMEIKEAANKEETRYHPPTLDGDVLASNLMMSEGVVVHQKVMKAVQEGLVDKRSEVVGDVAGKEGNEGVIASKMITEEMVLDEKKEGDADGVE